MYPWFRELFCFSGGCSGWLEYHTTNHPYKWMAIIRRIMNASIKDAFDRFGTWNSNRSPLWVTGPLTTQFGGGGGKSSGIIVEVERSLEGITVLNGTPLTGQRHVQFELSGASFAIELDLQARLTVQYPDGRWVFFVQRGMREIQLIPIKKRGIR
jgi:hypothetical protein